ncbi:fructose-6-phosphate aldolase [Bartonella quintana]|uniref:Probable transaldolase n=3 Tax=Bartonella quintana TaxID=803 RepID=TAL_BARQU|nr:fructose-6-phosphate aldolase [Bartonella quintana]Q6FYL8.1 RecName: Full=Probable transaldolase [Bartonella quintana str. Toulouse]ETS12827.1 fructose-6-phosphate aldolase [Bartonella quintana BQ2-D70]ETS14751.1 fructose-6-phosphate aldolase [Bartonella quintana JK 73rel]ETS17184.1 fructose-6-phosphate aldolase [Bartonella quintana JK 73]ETS17278.1 fructose-6-phosphate aldolase [Bartonella quintana JK 12]ETS19476.1 fructose-6-phosphate aldolase [Bartonella quintana JK 7]
MKFFVDSANIEEIRELQNLSLVDGVTTNPSLILKSGRNILDVIKEICTLIEGPVSAEVAATEFEIIMKEAAILAKIADNICIKLPLTLEGLKACKALAAQGLKTNLTLCFSANQALLAAKAGATFVSPFIGRLDDCGINGSELLHEIRTIYDNYGFETQILAASIRTVNHVKEAALSGADVASVPPTILKALVKHPLTDKGLQTFLDDWKKTGQNIA